MIAAKKLMFCEDIVELQNFKKGLRIFIYLFLIF